MASEIKVTEWTTSSGAGGLPVEDLHPADAEKALVAASALGMASTSRISASSSERQVRAAPGLRVTLPSRTRSRLITSLGRQLASAGPAAGPLGALAYADRDGRNGPGPRRHNSAQRLGSLWRTLELPGDARDAVDAWTARCSWWTTASRPAGR